MINHTCCRALLANIKSDVRKHTTVQQRRNVYARRSSHRTMEFHGPDGFYHTSSACCVSHAKYLGWEAYLRHIGVEEYQFNYEPNRKEADRMCTEPITLEEAKALRHGTELHMTGSYNADGTCRRWRVVGKVQTSPEHVAVALKHGLYVYGRLTEETLRCYHTKENCSKEKEE